MRNSTAPIFLIPLDNGQCCAVSAVLKPGASSLTCAPVVNIDKRAGQSFLQEGSLLKLNGRLKLLFSSFYKMVKVYVRTISDHNFKY